MVLLGSDKTHLTGHIGDKECHALYLSSGNINSDIRSEINARCWLMIGQIPVVKFKEKDYQGLLSNRLFHLCLDISCEDLKACAKTAERFPDARGDIRLWRTLLAGHLGDLPEHLNAVATSQARSPHSLATTKEFGNPLRKGLRTGRYVLDLIDNLVRNNDPSDLATFKQKAAEVGLNGVHKPYWRDWEFADPSDFIAIDLLHGLTKFSGDHVVKWMKKLIRKDEIDRRFSVLQRSVGRKHFSEGITRIKQHTRSEESDVLRHIVAISKGAPRVHDGIMNCLRAFADFAYVAQYEYHNDETIGYLEEYLARFHTYKGAFAAAGLRKKMNNEFAIPKMEGFLHYSRKIRRNGSLPQFSTQTTERLHIPMAKEPYHHTNKKDYEVQMCRYLDRNEQVALFGIQLQWRKLLDDLEDNMDCETDEEPDPIQEQKEHELAMTELATNVLPKEIDNFFTKKRAIKTETSAFLVTGRAHLRDITLEDIATRYKIHDLHAAIVKYCQCLGVADWWGDRDIPFTSVDAWKYVRLQLKTVQDDSKLAPPQTVMAAPPSEEFPFGWCNFVLVREDLEDISYIGISKWYMTQVFIKWLLMLYSAKENAVMKQFLTSSPS